MQKNLYIHWVCICFSESVIKHLSFPVVSSCDLLLYWKIISYIFPLPQISMPFLYLLNSKTQDLDIWNILLIKRVRRFRFALFTVYKRKQNLIIISVHIFCRCESGVIEKQCTPTSDTLCGTKGTILKHSKVQHGPVWEAIAIVQFYTLAIVIPDSSGH